MSSYHEWMQKIFSLTSAKLIKPGFERIELLLEALGNPHHHLQCVHIAGTNGKGSVSTKIAQGLQIHGHKVGLYTSPHISSFRERIRINGRMIDEQAVVDFLEKIMPLADKIGATFFEITTALAFDYFYEEGISMAVLETGLGGRLDATNVCRPVLSVITSISIDHANILGNTREQIAFEKAGIIKPMVPVVIGPRVPVEVVRRVAEERKSPLDIVEGQFENFEEENRAVAALSLKKLNAFSEEALEALPPCRFEEHRVGRAHVVLDVAHNEDGIEKLFSRLKKRFPKEPITAIYGASKDKDVAACLRQFLPHVQKVFFVAASIERRMLPEELLQLSGDSEKCASSSIEEAMEQAVASGGVVVVFGTFYIMAEVRRLLGIHEPVDNQQI